VASCLLRCGLAHSVSHSDEKPQPDHSMLIAIVPGSVAVAGMLGAVRPRIEFRASLALVPRLSRPQVYSKPSHV
jgi:hypothetical protein